MNGTRLLGGHLAFGQSREGLNECSWGQHLPEAPAGVACAIDPGEYAPDVVFDDLDIDVPHTSQSLHFTPVTIRNPLSFGLGIVPPGTK